MMGSKEGTVPEILWDRPVLWDVGLLSCLRRPPPPLRLPANCSAHRGPRPACTASAATPRDALRVPPTALCGRLSRSTTPSNRWKGLRPADRQPERLHSPAGPTRPPPPPGFHHRSRRWPPSTSSHWPGVPLDAPHRLRGDTPAP